jgi:hypothetical protein
MEKFLVVPIFQPGVNMFVKQHCLVRCMFMDICVYMGLILRVNRGMDKRLSESSILALIITFQVKINVAMYNNPEMGSGYEHFQ